MDATNQDGGGVSTDPLTPPPDAKERPASPDLADGLTPDEAALDAIRDVLADMYGPMPGADWGRHALTFWMLIRHRAVIVSTRSGGVARADRPSANERPASPDLADGHDPARGLEVAPAPDERLTAEIQTLRMAWVSRERGLHTAHGHAGPFEECPAVDCRVTLEAQRQWRGERPGGLVLGVARADREAAPQPPGTRLIRFSEGLFESMAASFMDGPVTIEWGELDKDGAFTPTVSRLSGAALGVGADREAAPQRVHALLEAVARLETDAVARCPDCTAPSDDEAACIDGAAVRDAIMEWAALGVGEAP